MRSLKSSSAFLVFFWRLFSSTRRRNETRQRKIAFNTNRDGNEEIYVMNQDGTGQTRLTNDAASDVDRHGRRTA